jgi:TetR/AcrR family transcriptional regulator, transcriptional repressor for nem operon
MPPRTQDKRSRLVDAAVKLVHHQGFHRTTLAELAHDARVPLGNVYYYFKTKEALGEALVERYVSEYAAMRGEWESLPDPKSRLEALVRMTVDQKDILARSGCPVGTLSSELNKDGGHLAGCATRLFSDQLEWAEHQFRLLGKSKREAQGCAIHLLSAIEGVSLLAHALGDPKYVTQETQRLLRWIRGMEITRR